MPKFQSISSKLKFFSFLSTNRKNCSENGFETSNRHNSKTGWPTETKFCKIYCGYQKPLILEFHQITTILKISCFLKKFVFIGFTNFELLTFSEVWSFTISSEIDSWWHILPPMYTTLLNLNTQRCFSAQSKSSFL